MIVNVGSKTLPTELRLKTGWIIASDVDIALQEGGTDQEILELGACAAHAEIDVDEDIFLVGHGSAGLVGSRLPANVAAALRPIIPGGYTGIIRSLSCSTGAPSGGTTAVHALRSELRQRGRRTTVRGVSATTLNHSAYLNSSRAIRPNREERYVDPEIERTIGSVNEDWAAWVRRHGVRDLKKAALMATALSMNFYERLQRRVRHHLVPEEATFTTVRRRDVSIYPADMVRPGQRRRARRARRRGR